MPAAVDTLPAPLTTTAPPPAGPPVMLTTAEVAELLRVNVWTVRGYVRDGVLPAYRIGREARIKASDLDAWLTTRRTA